MLDLKSRDITIETKEMLGIIAIKFMEVYFEVPKIHVLR